ncbi:aminotransferase class I/II-fold pyridoxal phosphate-dependent enzyme, partial [Bradyrhizobium sp. 33ap4]|uniref:aminotransferase class I/II-fold pyridoxal phosphate-dependent enzyme n=1 Tax=Bradyrhizobium sp. 33ap4 TaxID=3061630 RepID=UPI003977B8F4
MALARALRRHAHLHVLSDEIYEKLVHNADFAIMITVAPNGALTASTFTKVRAMAQSRALIKIIILIKVRPLHTSARFHNAAIEALSGARAHPQSLTHKSPNLSCSRESAGQEPDVC